MLRWLKWIRIFGLVITTSWVVLLTALWISPYEYKSDTGLDLENRGEIRELQRYVQTIRDTQIKLVSDLANLEKNVEKHHKSEEERNFDSRITLLEKKIDVLIAIGGFMSMTFMAQVIFYIVKIKADRQLTEVIEGERVHNDPSQLD